jgi:hypothetical protein
MLSEHLARSADCTGLHTVNMTEPEHGYSTHCLPVLVVVAYVVYKAMSGRKH